ncbi:23S rRNA (uracil1939-C5)-methyltransferase [Sphingomonas jejuensis]|uniref:23S rRNA (Uracil1939-C5)-methyltransferase n=1 Tax=Sphingomonas jejuensis TaxID=904715 RepID=A0ABX0XJW6_9SPHN|nr:class I SAM-dependent RNA methyltransferase [Sphingomonas jejuensis]NJC33641.1 23S rRNA (uracil1939-C5)-methyltransferase [Sphingomonas jejuensis]
MSEDTDLIIRIAARGDGVTADGRHAQFAAPGDRLDGAGLVHPGPHHQQPPCRHFPECGGCQLQHVDDDAYRAYLTDRVAGALDGAGVAQSVILPPHLSPPRTRRRASLRAERVGKRVAIGFNAGGSHRIVDMRECHVLSPRLFALVDPLRRLLAPLLPPRRTATITMTLCDQGVDLALAGVSVEGLAAAESLTDFAAAQQLARLSVDEGYGAESRWEPRPATVTLGGVAVALPPGAFLQATGDGEAALVEGVLQATEGAERTADLFAGLGTFALALPGRVLAAEAARDAVLALKGAAGRAGRHLAVDHRDLYRRPLTSAELSSFDAAVIDPPRAGAREQVEQLAAADVARLAYVSCNPATFARDAAILVAGGWRLHWVRPVGQFRWSTHIELVAAFAR